MTTNNNEKDIHNMIDEISNDIFDTVEVLKHVDDEIDVIELEFEKATKLNKTDVEFVFFATALQCVKQYLLTNFEDRLGDQEAAKKVKNDHVEYSDRPEDEWFLPSVDQILSNPVPFDAQNQGAVKGFLKGGGKLGHRLTLGHDPILGWIFGTSNIATSTITKWTFETRHVKTGLDKKDLISNDQVFVLNMLDKAFGRFFINGIEGLTVLGASIVKEWEHLKSDIDTKHSLPFPILSTVSPKLVNILAKNHIDMANMLTVSKQFTYAFVINILISFIYELYIKEIENIDLENNDELNFLIIRSKKIINLSNIIASTSNILAVSLVSGGALLFGNPELAKKGCKYFDLGGFANTLWRLVSDVKFINEIKKEFIKNKWQDKVMGQEYYFIKENNGMNQKEYEQGLKDGAKIYKKKLQKVEEGMEFVKKQLMNRNDVEKITKTNVIIENDNAIESRLEESIDDVINLCKDEDKYLQLREKIKKYVQLKKNFGKEAKNINKIVYAELSKQYPNIAIDSIISINSIEKGYIIFTTAAMYIKIRGEKTKFGYSMKYERIAYEKILYEKLALVYDANNKHNKLCIYYKQDEEDDENQCEKCIMIDDAILNEEKLNDLLVAIHKEKCLFSDTDMYINFVDFDNNIKNNFFKLLCYIIYKNHKNRIALFLNYMVLDLDSDFEDTIKCIKEDGSDDSIINELINEIHNNITYPSERAVSEVLIQKTMTALAISNYVESKPMGQLTNWEREILDKLNFCCLGKKAYEKLIIKSSKLESNLPHITISLLNKEIKYSLLKDIDDIKYGLELLHNLVVNTDGSLFKDFANQTLDKVKVVKDLINDKLINKNNGDVNIPKEYKIIDDGKMKTDINKIDLINYVLFNNEANCCINVYTVSDDNEILFEVDKIIESFHNNNDENIGLLEVKAERTLKNIDYVYSISKIKQNDIDGVCYNLNINIVINGKIKNINGRFIEKGIVGKRDLTVLNLLQNYNVIKEMTDEKDNFTHSLIRWARDPYDIKYDKGFLMNISENSIFDGIFPMHPLSMARKFVKEFSKLN